MCIDGPRATKTPCDRAQKSDTYFSAAVNHGAADRVESKSTEVKLHRDKAILAVVDIGHVWE